MAILLRENSRKRLAWDGLIAAIAIYTLIALPLAWIRARTEQHGFSPLWNLFSLLGLLDFGLNLITSFERDGGVVRNPRDIRRAYLRGMAPIDLLTNLPPLLVSLLGMPGSVLSLLALLRGARLFFLSSRWEYLNQLDIRWLRMTRYVIAILVLTHWMACLWLWVGLSEPAPGSWIAKAGWSGRSFDFQYEKSLFWAVTLVTVGYGQIFPETDTEIRVAMVMMSASLLIYTFAIANMLTILNQFDAGRSAYHEHQSMLRRFLEVNGVGKETINRVRLFNDYQWSRTRGLNTNALLEGLPAELRDDILLEMMRDTLHNMPLLAEAPPGLQKRLLEALEPVTFPPGTVVLEADQPGEKIIFITRGCVSIQATTALTEDVRRIQAGDYIGELSFFLHERRTCRVIADSYVVGFVLGRSAYETLRDQEPRLYQLLRQIAMDESKRNQALLLEGVVV